MLKCARLDDAFLSFSTASKPNRKEGEKKPKNVGLFSRPKTKFHFCACPSPNVVKRYAGGKKGKLLRCKRIFDRINAKLAEIQLKKHQNVQKTHFFSKSFRSQWVMQDKVTAQSSEPLNSV